MNRYFFLFLGACFLFFSSTKVAACPSIGSHDFYNATYAVKSEGLLKSGPYQFRARLKKGMFEESHGDASLNYIFARIRSVRFGDLTNDGIDDAAVAIEYGPNSASFFLTNYFVFACKAGSIKLLSSIEQDELQDQTLKVVFESSTEPIYISKGVLFIRHGVDGSRPSPSFVASFRYRITNNRFRRLGRPLFKRNL